MTKKYQANRGLIHFCLTIDGKEITFYGGTNQPWKVACFYVTDDEELMEKLEKHPLYNDSWGFSLVEEINKIENATSVVQGTVTTRRNVVTESPKPEYADNTEDESIVIDNGDNGVRMKIGETESDNTGVEAVEGITNAQGAKEWLRENKDATYSEVKNVVAINTFCKEVGVTFPDWEQK